MKGQTSGPVLSLDSWLFGTIVNESKLMVGKNTDIAAISEKEEMSNITIKKILNGERFWTGWKWGLGGIKMGV